MFAVKSVDEVIAIIRQHFSGYLLENEAVDLGAALGRVTAETVTARHDIPGFDRSAVDGYAVIASDTYGSGEALPAQLRLVGEVQMGESPAFQMEKGQTVAIPTGGQLPKPADAVVMKEYTENLGDGFIYVHRPVPPGAHIVFRGDDLRVGDPVITAGTIIRPQEIGALAAIGQCSVLVKRRLKIGIIATGDEIVPIERSLSGSKVRDVNSYTMEAEAQSYGTLAKRYGIIEDNYEMIRATMERALAESDLVLISGGSSVGTRDETCKVIESLGDPGILVHGIAVKPGKPTIIGEVRGKAVVGLPGHPAAAFFVFRIFVRELIDRMLGLPNRTQYPVKAEILCNYPSNHGREEYVPVRLLLENGRVLAQPVFGKSGLITQLTGAEGYIRIERGTEGLTQGAVVDVLLF